MTDFDLGPGVLSVTASGSIFNGELFFAKYDGLGNNLWIKNIGNGSLIENVISIQTDSYGNYLIGGSFNDVLDFDPSIAVFSLSNTGSGSLPDIYFAKYDNNFNFLWARNIGGPYGDVPYDLNIDYQNNILLTGYFQSSSPVDFDPGSGTAFLNTNTTNNSIFIAKYQNITTDLEDKYITHDKNLIVYPNPTFDNINILLPEQTTSMDIYSSLGVLVYTNSIQANNSKKLKQINVSKLTAGIYYFKVKANGNSTYYTRFIKQ